MNSIEQIALKTNLLITRDQSNNVSLRLDPIKCFTLAFAGSPATFLERNEYNKLSPSEITNLKNCGINVESTHYINGLVGIQLRNTNRISDLYSLKIYLQSEILCLLSDHEYILNSTLNKLWIEYQEIRYQLMLILQNEEITEKIIETLLRLKYILTQVGCLVLPKELLSMIKHPQQFLDNIAPNVGNYAISLIAVDNNAS